jgi:hypothetical protein
VKSNAIVKVDFKQNATLNLYAHNADTTKTKPGFDLVDNKGTVTFSQNKVLSIVARRSKNRFVLGGEFRNQLDSLEFSIADSLFLTGRLINEKSIKMKNSGDWVLASQSEIRSSENARIYLYSAGSKLKTANGSKFQIANVKSQSFLALGALLHNASNSLIVECNNTTKSQSIPSAFNGPYTKLIVNKVAGLDLIQTGNVEVGTLSVRNGNYNLGGFECTINDSLNYRSATNYLVAGNLTSNRSARITIQPRSMRVLSLQFKPDYAVLKNVQLIGKDTAFLTVNLVSAMNIKGGEDGGSGPGLLAINKNAKLVIPTGAELALESDTFNAGLSLGAPAQRSIVCTGTGKFNIERDHYGVRGWRLYSHPFKSDIDLQEVANDIELIGSGGTAEGFYSDNYKNAAAYGYDYSKADSTASTDPAWTAFTSAKGNTISGNANKWNKNSTLLLFNPGNRRGTDAFGSPSTATYEQGKITLSYTLDSTAVHLNDGTTQTINTGVLPSKSKYFFITNPFTAPVKLCMIQGLNSSNVDPYFYYWKQRRNTVVDNFSPAEWQAEKIVVGNNTRDSNISIPAFGTILVRMKNISSTTFTIPESAKQLSNYNYIIGGAKGVSKTGLMFADATGSDIGQNGVEIKLLVNDSQEADRVLIYNEPNQSPAYTTYDAVKYLNQDFPNIYTLSADAKPLAIDMQDIKSQLDAGQPEVIIPLGVNRESDKRFSSLKWELSENTTGMDLYLKDLQTQQVEPWSTGVAKSIALDAQSLTTKRYALVFRLRTSAVKDPINETAKNNGSKSLVMLVYPNPTDGKISLKLSNGESYQGGYELFDMVGRLVQKGNSNDKKQLDLSALVDGQYLLKSKYNVVIIIKK